MRAETGAREDSPQHEPGIEMRGLLASVGVWAGGGILYCMTAHECESSLLPDNIDVL